MQLNVELIDGKLHVTNGKLAAAYLRNDLRKAFPTLAVPTQDLYEVWAKAQFMLDAAAALGSEPAIFTVVAGSYEQDDEGVAESPDYISNPVTWPEAVVELAKCSSHAFSRIECGSLQIGPTALKSAFPGGWRPGETPICSARTDQSKQEASL